LQNFFVSSTFFVHQGQFYIQDETTNTGSPLPPLPNNTFMAAFDEEATQN